MFFFHIVEPPRCDHAVLLIGVNKLDVNITHLKLLLLWLRLDWLEILGKYNCLVIINITH